MAGVTPTVGENAILSAYLESANTFLGLYQDTDLGEASTWADITPQTGTGYSEATLASGNWTIAAGEATYSIDIDFTATAGDWDTTYGYYIRDGSNVLLHFENNGAAVDIADTQTYRVIINLAAA